MLTEHGILPHVVVALPMREKILMMELISKQSEINKKALKK